MTWHENLQDFGEEIEPDATFRFECQPQLSCFGMCCRTEITLTPYDIARMRRHLDIDSGMFLSTYCETYIDSRTGFPFVILKHKKDGACVFLSEDGCDLYESRPSCCRNYPLARVIDEDDNTGKRLIKYYLQQRATYCEGLGRGPDWTIWDYCESNRLGPYEKANDFFLDIPFAFNRLPYKVRQDTTLQSTVFQAAFNFDQFFKKYGRSPNAGFAKDDHEMIVLVRDIILNLIRRAAHLRL